MKLKDASIGSVITPGRGWESFSIPGCETFPTRLEVVAHAGSEGVICRPLGGGPEISFYGELEVQR